MNNFCVISKNQLVIPSVIIKPNARFTIIPPTYFINYRVDTRPESLVRLIEVQFEYQINSSARSVLGFGSDNINPPPKINGPILLRVRGDYTVTEVRNMASNGEFYEPFTDFKTITYVRSSNVSIEQALTAASLITKDPVKIASLAARACGINIPSLFLFDLDALCEGLTAINKVITKNLESKFSISEQTNKIFDLVNKFIHYTVREYDLNINLEEDNVETKLPIWK